MPIKMDNSAVEKVAKDARKKLLTSAVNRVALRAQAEAPVQTGNLRRNIKANLPSGLMYIASVDSNAPYSVYVHEGTRNQSANPYLARALEAVGKSG
jgi:HK97 gp10 family phage protein